MEEEVVLEEETVTCPKEMNDVRKCIKDLVIDIRKGKDVGVIAMENLPGLVNAIDGYEKLPAAAKHPTAGYAGGLLAGDIAFALQTPKEELEG